MDFDHFKEQLLKRKKRFDLWNGIIDELNAEKSNSQKLQKEKEKLEKVLNEEKKSDKELMISKDLSLFLIPIFPKSFSLMIRTHHGVPDLPQRKMNASAC